LVLRFIIIGQREIAHLCDIAFLHSQGVDNESCEEQEEDAQGDNWVDLDAVHRGHVVFDEF
jgi:hypothetical protein